MKKPQKNKEARRYDKILKENIQQVVKVLIERILKIKIAKTEILYPELSITLGRSADFVLLGATQEGEETIYHIEFQSQNDGEMPNRNFLYSALFSNTYRKPVKQIVIYMGNAPLSMSSKIEMPDFTFQYELIDIRTFSYKDFLNSNIPEEVILAILCNFENQTNDLVISEIPLKLRSLDKCETLFKRHFAQLEVISGLRNLEETINKLRQNMPNQMIFDIEKLPSYREGLEKGLEKGLQKGLKLGAEKVEKAMHETAKKLLQKGYALAEIQEITGLSLFAIKKIKKELENQ